MRITKKECFSTPSSLLSETNNIINGLRNYCCARGKEIFYVANDKVFMHINGSNSVELQAENMGFPISKICLCDSGEYLAVVGIKLLTILYLPKILKTDASFIKVQSFPVCKSKFHDDSFANIADVAWHPLSETFADLVILTSSGDLSLFDISTHSAEKPVVNCQRGRRRFGCNDDFDEFVTFAFGKASFLDPWSELSVTLLTRNGCVYHVCPFFPARIRMDTLKPEALIDCVVRQSLMNPERESAGVRMISWIKKFRKISSANTDQCTFQIPWASEIPKLLGPIPLDPCCSEESIKASSLISLKTHGHSLVVSFENGAFGIYSFLSQIYPTFLQDNFTLREEERYRLVESISIDNDTDGTILMLNDVVNSNLFYAASSFKVFAFQINAFDSLSDGNCVKPSKAQLVLSSKKRTWGFCLSLSDEGEYLLLYFCQGELYGIPLILGDLLEDSDFGPPINTKDDLKGKSLETFESSLDVFLDKILGKEYNGLPLMPISAEDYSSSQDAQIMKILAKKLGSFREKYIKSLMQIDSEIRFRLVAMKSKLAEQSENVAHLLERAESLETKKNDSEKLAFKLVSSIGDINAKLNSILTRIHTQRQGIMSQKELQLYEEMKKQKNITAVLESRINVIKKEWEIREASNAKNTDNVSLLPGQKSKIGAQLKKQYEVISVLKKKLNDFNDAFPV